MLAILSAFTCMQRIVSFADRLSDLESGQSRCLFCVEYLRRLGTSQGATFPRVIGGWGIVGII